MARRTKTTTAVGDYCTWRGTPKQRHPANTDVCSTSSQQTQTRFRYHQPLFDQFAHLCKWWSGKNAVINAGVCGVSPTAQTPYWTAASRSLANGKVLVSALQRYPLPPCDAFTASIARSQPVS